ncbi:MAG: hypothetical protein ACOC8B_00795 [Gemmatimonadota bacterium]
MAEPGAAPGYRGEVDDPVLRRMFDDGIDSSAPRANRSRRTQLMTMALRSAWLPLALVPAADPLADSRNTRTLEVVTRRGESVERSSPPSNE